MSNRRLRILELCPFSAGICGVWNRVLSESSEFVHLNHKVLVLSSNTEKGTEEICASKDNIFGVIIKRFEAKSSMISENVKYWFKRNQVELIGEISNFSPDIIITHLLHPHSADLSNLLSRLKLDLPNLKAFIVPHAPFNITRKFPLNLITSIWRRFKMQDLNNFNKVIAITRWEIPYLNKMGVKPEKIVYIPNGIPLEFFQIKKSKKPTRGVLFLGRIAPVKYLETLIMAASLLPKINFSIVGPAEKNYLRNIKLQIKKLRLTNVSILPPVFDIKEKISIIDNHNIFVLPSKREAMPQALIEAMARGKLVISSNTDGGKEIIKDGITGLLFEIGDYKSLAKLIESNYLGGKKIAKNARSYSKCYSWKKLIKLYLNLFDI